MRTPLPIQMLLHVTMCNSSGSQSIRTSCLDLDEVSRGITRITHLCITSYKTLVQWYKTRMTWDKTANTTRRQATNGNRPSKAISIHRKASRRQETSALWLTSSATSRDFHGGELLWQYYWNIKNIGKACEKCLWSISQSIATLRAFWLVIFRTQFERAGRGGNFLKKLWFGFALTKS